MTPYRLCPACGALIDDTIHTRGRCAPCRKQYERDKSKRRRERSHATQSRGTKVWKEARTAARARDGGCIHRHQGGCHGQIQVHHVIPLERGGTNALHNLVTLCRAHHEQAEAGLSGRYRARV